MNEQSLGVKFEIQDMDRMIARYGHTPHPDEGKSLEEYLRSQKDQFKELERTRARAGRDREH